jgi:outer membrane cobalamin receptor
LSASAHRSLITWHFKTPLNTTIRTFALATSTLLASLSIAGAQTASPGGEIRGRVMNSAAQAPIARATVEARSATDSSPVASATTDSTGAFLLGGLSAGTYRIRVRALGYSPRDVRAIVISATTTSVNVGTVALVATATQLTAQVVTAEKHDVELAPDKNTFVVRDQPTNRGGSALDVLRNVPSVDVDIDNIVSLRGNSGVIVQINGRPSPLKPAQLGNFLAQLPASMVDKIELIPNPSARDNPEGSAGIINIVMKKQTDAGTSGGVNVAAGTTGRIDVGGSFGYQSGGLTLFGSYGFLRDSRPRTDSVYRKNLFAAPLTYLDERGRRTQIPLAHTFTGSAGYKLTKQDDISADFMFSTRNETESNSILYRNLDASGTLTGLSDRVTRGINHEFNLESTLGYEHAFEGDEHKLSAELAVNRNREGGPTSLVARTLALNGASPSVTALENATPWEHPGENSIKLDYVRPLSRVVRLETGYKGSQQRFHTTLDTQVFDATRNAYFADTSRISNFTYRQLVNAGYAMIDANPGKVVLQGGLRVERAATRFHLNTLGATYNNAYNSLFPSALVAYNFDESRQVKLSYSTRIRRPDDTDQLDPTAHFQDPLNLSRGNPYLRPEYIRALELGLQRSGDNMTVQLTPFFRHTVDAIRSIRTIDGAGVATRTFANVASTDAYGADATVALSGGWLGGFAGASAFRQVSNAANLSPGLSAKTFGWSARTNITARLSTTVDVQALVSYQAPTTVEQGWNASRTRFNIAARKKLKGDRMDVTLRVIDPFNTSRERSATNDPRFYQLSNRARVIRGVLVGANWTFGKLPKKKKDDTLVADPGAL